VTHCSVLFCDVENIFKIFQKFLKNILFPFLILGLVSVLVLLIVSGLVLLRAVSIIALQVNSDHALYLIV
jgi:hypothetical protein